MNTSIVGYRGIRDGVIHTGAVALLLGAALAMNPARAAETDARNAIAPPAPAAPSAATRPAATAPAVTAAPGAATRPAATAPAVAAAPGATTASPTAPDAPAAPDASTADDLARERADRDRERAKAESERTFAAADARMREAQRRMKEAQRQMNDAQGRMGAERADLDERLREAQERMNRAAQELAAAAAERASEAMESFTFIDGSGGPREMYSSRALVIGVDLDSSSKGGAAVRDVSPGGPAEEAGIRAGDVIVSVNGKDVKSDKPGESSRKVVRELQSVRAQRGRGPDDKIKVQVLRDGKRKDFEVTPRRVANAFVFTPPSPPEPAGHGELGPFNFNYNFFVNSDLAGLEVTTLTPQLGRYFGTSKGVLVVRAPKSDTYKLQDGDVIVAIDGREPTSGAHITRILSSYQPGEKVTLRVMRDRQTQEIQVTLPDRRQSGLHLDPPMGEAM